MLPRAVVHHSTTNFQSHYNRCITNTTASQQTNNVLQHRHHHTQTQTSPHHPPLRRQQGHLHHRPHLLLRPLHSQTHPREPKPPTPTRITLSPHRRQRLRQKHTPTSHLRKTPRQTRGVHHRPRSQFFQRHSSQLPPCLPRDRMGVTNGRICRMRRSPHGGYSRV